MRHTFLTLTNPRHGKAGVRTPNAEKEAGSAALRRDATGEICIRKEVWLKLCQFVTYPPYHTYMEGRPNVANQAVKFAVFLGAPTREETRKVTDSS